MVIWGKFMALAMLLGTVGVWGDINPPLHCAASLAELNPFLIKLKNQYLPRVEESELSPEEAELMAKLEHAEDEGVKLPATGTAEEVMGRVHRQIRLNELRSQILSSPDGLFVRLGIGESPTMQRLLLEYCVDTEKTDWEIDAAAAKALLLKHPDDVLAIAKASFSVLSVPIKTEDPERLLLQRIILNLGHLGSSQEIIHGLEFELNLKHRSDRFATLLENYLKSEDSAWPVVDEESLGRFQQAIP